MIHKNVYVIILYTSITNIKFPTMKKSGNITELVTCFISNECLSVKMMRSKDSVLYIIRHTSCLFSTQYYSLQHCFITQAQHLLLHPHKSKHFFFKRKQDGCCYQCESHNLDYLFGVRLN